MKLAIKTLEHELDYITDELRTYKQMIKDKSNITESNLYYKDKIKDCEEKIMSINKAIKVLKRIK
jgi:hypothetical protein